MSIGMPNLSEIQLPVKDEAEMALIDLEKNDLESAEQRFYGIYKWLKDFNGSCTQVD